MIIYKCFCIILYFVTNCIIHLCYSIFRLFFNIQLFNLVIAVSIVTAFASSLFSISSNFLLISERLRHYMKFKNGNSAAMKIQFLPKPICSFLSLLSHFDLVYILPYIAVNEFAANFIRIYLNTCILYLQRKIHMCFFPLSNGEIPPRLPYLRS